MKYSPTEKTSQRRDVAAASVVSAAGAAIFLILPLIVGTATVSWQLNSEKAGLIASSYFLGYLLICLSTVFWIYKVDWRHVSLVGFSLLGGGLVVSAFAQDYMILLGGMFVSGIGGGGLFALALCIIAQTENPDRYFGVKLVAEQLLGVALLFSLPLLIAAGYGFSEVILATGCVLTALGIASFWVPRETDVSLELEGDDTKRAVSLLPLWIGLAALFVYFSGLSAVWAFAERIADGNGIDTVTIGRGLSFGLFGGGLGALAAALLGDRFGRTLPLALSALILAAVMWVYNAEFSGFTFAVATFFFSGAWNYSLAYQMGIVASVDVSGRFAVTMSAALALGAAVGPALAGMLVQQSGFGLVILFAIFAVFVSTVPLIRLAGRK
jgi:predicted MFS family arabinose efflux permease|tara:strand:+ start:7999 stop:9147 length:1149 start_codon:yes stop_codon:yes gene_type:complete